MSIVRLGVIGADGRMGQAVQACATAKIASRAANGADWHIHARITEAGSDYPALSDCDVVIDFSAPEALITALPHLRDGAALISGTTGLSAADEREVALAAKRLAILRSGNFSLGIAVLSKLAEQAAAVLGEGWDIEITEMHHRHKVDAPSGTALMLGEAAARGRTVALDGVAAHDRAGLRREGDIGFSVLRGGGVYGTHDVRLVSESEMITLGHQALNRDVFAHGALRAAEWLCGKPAGAYALTDLL